MSDLITSYEDHLAECHDKLGDALERVAEVEAELAAAIKKGDDDFKRISRLNKEFKGIIIRQDDELAEIKETHDKVMSEDCAPDERHCACVPFLRAELADLRAAIKVVRKSDCGGWLKDCITTTFKCSDGREKRRELAKTLDALYKQAEQSLREFPAVEPGEG